MGKSPPGALNLAEAAPANGALPATVPLDSAASWRQSILPGIHTPSYASICPLPVR